MRISGAAGFVLLMLALATPAAAFAPACRLPQRAAGMREVSSLRMSSEDVRGSRRWAIRVLPGAAVLAGVAPQLVQAAEPVAAAEPTATFLQRAVRIPPRLPPGLVLRPAPAPGTDRWAMH